MGPTHHGSPLKDVKIAHACVMPKFALVLEGGQVWGFETCPETGIPWNLWPESLVILNGSMFSNQEAKHPDLVADQTMVGQTWLLGSEILYIYSKAAIGGEQHEALCQLQRQQEQT